VWTVDCAPAFATALGDVEGRIVVGVGNDPARSADEGFLVEAVASVTVTAPVTGLGGVPRVDFDQRYTGPACHVGQERAEVVVLVHHPPTVAISTLVNSLKTVSARYLRQEHATHLRRYLWGAHLWSPSYFAGSCGGAP